MSQRHSEVSEISPSVIGENVEGDSLVVQSTSVPVRIYSRGQNTFLVERIVLLYVTPASHVAKLETLLFLHPSCSHTYDRFLTQLGPK
jgi:hypothetical protein